MNGAFSPRHAGFTLPEVLVGAAIASIVFAALAVGAVSLQRTFAAVEGFGTGQRDQMRTLDYISRDVRRAKSVSVATSPAALTLRAETYIDPASNLPRSPMISDGGITYGGTTTIIYSLSGSNLVREEKAQRLVVAHNIRAFTPALVAADSQQKTVNVTLSFASPMKWRSDAPTSVTLQATSTARN